MYLDIILTDRAGTFSTLISFYYRHGTFSTLTAFYYRDGIFSTLMSFYYMWYHDQLEVQLQEKVVASLHHVCSKVDESNSASDIF